MVQLHAKYLLPIQDFLPHLPFSHTFAETAPPSEILDLSFALKSPIFRRPCSPMILLKSCVSVDADMPLFTRTVFFLS